MVEKGISKTTSMKTPPKYLHAFHQELGTLEAKTAQQKSLKSLFLATKKHLENLHKQIQRKRSWEELAKKATQEAKNAIKKMKTGRYSSKQSLEKDWAKIYKKVNQVLKQQPQSQALRAQKKILEQHKKGLLSAFERERKRFFSDFKTFQRCPKIKDESICNWKKRLLNFRFLKEGELKTLQTYLEDIILRKEEEKRALEIEKERKRRQEEWIRAHNKKMALAKKIACIQSDISICHERIQRCWNSLGVYPISEIRAHHIKFIEEGIEDLENRFLSPPNPEQPHSIAELKDQLSDSLLNNLTLDHKKNLQLANKKAPQRAMFDMIYILLKKSQKSAQINTLLKDLKCLEKNRSLNLIALKT